jgi:hypothetical protein
MNNYLSLNLVSGRLGRVAGGGRPKFVLDEQNEVQLYVLDFPKPSTYPPDSLSDAYAYEIIPRDFSGSSVTLRAGVRGGSAIISTNSFFNLPTNLALNSSANASLNLVEFSSQQKVLLYDVFFSTSSIPSSGSLFSFTVTVALTFGGSTMTRTVTSATFSLDNQLSEINKILDNTINVANSVISDSSNTNLAPEVGVLYQASDYAYSYNKIINLTTAGGVTNVTLSVTLNNVSASSNPGKYGYLDFSSPSWDSVIGTKVETPIWMEAMIGSDTIAQGNAIICRKMT